MVKMPIGDGWFGVVFGVFVVRGDRVGFWFGGLQA